MSRSAAASSTPNARTIPIAAPASTSAVAPPVSQRAQAASLRKHCHVKSSITVQNTA